MTSERRYQHNPATMIARLSLLVWIGAERPVDLMGSGRDGLAIGSVPAKWRSAGAPPQASTEPCISRPLFQVSENLYQRPAAWFLLKTVQFLFGERNRLARVPGGGTSRMKVPKHQP